MLCESSLALPTTKALLALQLFHAARLAARMDDEGAVVLLEDQDRSLWDRELITAGQHWLGRSKDEAPTRFHFEAAIAMQHCTAASVDATDWVTIQQLYARLRELHESPIYALNQAIARAQAGDLQAGLAQLEGLREREDMRDYLLLDCAEARVHELLGDRDRAVDSYLRALGKRPASHEKRLLESKLQRLSGHA